jgi:hypothetical protein
MTSETIPATVLAVRSQAPRAGDIPSEFLPESRHRRIRPEDVLAFQARRERRAEGALDVADGGGGGISFDERFFLEGDADAWIVVKRGHTPV